MISPTASRPARRGRELCAPGTKHRKVLDLFGTKPMHLAEIRRRFGRLGLAGRVHDYLCHLRQYGLLDCRGNGWWAATAKRLPTAAARRKEA